MHILFTHCADEAAACDVVSFDVQICVGARARAHATKTLPGSSPAAQHWQRQRLSALTRSDALAITIDPTFEAESGQVATMG